MRKLAAYATSAALWGICLVLVVLIALEYLGGYALIERIDDLNKGRFPLHSSGYYERDYDSDPYEDFSIQRLHPFYMFSLPWKEEAIAAVNNDVVSLEEDGFRASVSNGAVRQAVVLGGSTAFGARSSSNATTLASVLNEIQSAYDFHNRGTPSWNSHQEFVSYSKLPFEAEAVVTLTGANDFTIARHYCRRGYDYPHGSPESFEYLAAILDDIRGERHDNDVLSALFPQTTEIVSRFLRKLIEPEKPTPDCTDAILEAADAFIDNQRDIRDLVEARGGVYLMALQPHLGFLRTPERERDAEEARQRARFYQRIAESAFCREANCLDLSTIFEGYDPLLVDDTPAAPHEAIFTDNVHLTDRGFAAVGERIGKELLRLADGD